MKPPALPHARAAHRRTSILPLVVALVVALASAACAPPPPPTPPPAFASDAGSAAALKGHIAVLASDSLMGRAPGTDGGRKAADYIANAFQAAGLAPGVDAGSFRQRVALSGTRVRHARVQGDIVQGDDRRALEPADLVIRTNRSDTLVRIDAPLRFIGHGIAAPEAGWNDFDGVDLEGAVAVVIPGIPDSLAEKLAGGASSFLGSPDGKSAEAAARGAVGIAYLVRPGAEESFARDRDNAEGLDHLVARFGDRLAIDTEIDLSPKASVAVLEALGLRWDSTTSARPRVVATRALDAAPTLSLSYAAEQRTRDADNVVGMIAGSGDEVVVVTAHYDAYGIGPADAQGDSIYNGAADNAAGTAGLIELARLMAARSEAPRRTLLFVATTAEEGGTLGARAFLHAPPVPRERLVAAVNVDGLGFMAPSDGFTVFPTEGTNAVSVVTPLAAPLGISLHVEPWHRSMHFAFDHAAFLARGIPAFTVWQSGAVRDEWKEVSATYGRTHTPGDEYHADWVDAGLTQHLQLYQALLTAFADGGTVPTVAADSPFLALGKFVIREQ